jgi:hypothetical protein
MMMMSFFAIIRYSADPASVPEGTTGRGAGAALRYRYMMFCI